MQVSWVLIHVKAIQVRAIFFWRLLLFVDCHGLMFDQCNFFIKLGGPLYDKENGLLVGIVSLYYFSQSFHRILISINL